MNQFVVVILGLGSKFLYKIWYPSRIFFVPYRKELRLKINSPHLIRSQTYFPWNQTTLKWTIKLRTVYVQMLTENWWFAMLIRSKCRKRVTVQCNFERAVTIAHEQVSKLKISWYSQQMKIASQTGGIRISSS